MSTQERIDETLAPMTVLAPIAGQVIPLEQVPDPVFAEKLVGDGISIDPIEQILRAPFDGEIIQLAKTFHAVTIRADNGLEMLIHIGIDTVMLKGEGFNALVSEGAQVKQGQALIEFDADYIARHAKALMTEVVVSNGDAMNSHIVAVSQAEVLTQQPLMTIEFGDVVVDNDVTISDWQTSELIALPNPNGLHARPAATLAKIARSFPSNIEISCHQKRVSAKSITSLLNLNTKLGDVIQFYAAGQNASVALNDLVTAVRNGLGEVTVEESESSSVQWDDEPSLLFPPNTHDQLLKGVCASAGMSIGVIHQLEEEQFDIPDTRHSTGVERAILGDAVSIAVEQLQVLTATLQAIDPDKAKIFTAHEELLADPELIDHAYRLIEEEACNAAHAWQQSLTYQVEQLRSLENQLLAERASDLQDVGHRVLRLILGQVEPEQNLPDQCILVAEDLTPSDTARLDKTKVNGFVTVSGGATSHTAILARSMNLPAITGIEPAARHLADGTRVILNSTLGELLVEPSEGDIQAALQQMGDQEKTRNQNLADIHQPAVTQDNVRIDVVANIGSVTDAQAVTESGGEGVGLLRSEFLFMNRTSAPSEDDQFNTYKAAAEAIGAEKPLIVRTLDVGGDKPLSYLPLPSEENPFLGERGIRISLDRPALFRQQLRALLRAAEFGNIHILLPMISDLHELNLAKQVIEEERQKLNVRAVPIGIMIEVPSAAVMADVLAPEVDFFSIGTNDLTQYTLAMDRGHPKLASLADALHPGVLRLIKMTVEAADKHGKWVGVCGGIAGEVLAAPLLVGLGVKELSASVPAIADIKACVRSLDSRKCQEMAAQSLQFSTASEVREYLETTGPFLK